MKSFIHETDAVDNLVHDFGEGLDPRIPAIFVRKDGRQTVLLFTRAQIVTAEERGHRESIEAEEVSTAAARNVWRDFFVSFGVGTVVFVLGLLIGGTL